MFSFAAAARQVTAVSRHAEVTSILTGLKEKGAEYQAHVRDGMAGGARVNCSDTANGMRAQVLERKRAFEYVDELSKKYNSKVRVD